jgi:hypothetical protein
LTRFAKLFEKCRTSTTGFNLCGRASSTLKIKNKGGVPYPWIAYQKLGGQLRDKDGKPKSNPNRGGRST